MIYKIDKKNYKTFDIFEKNKLEPRAYFIPFSSYDDALKTDYLDERYNSARVKMLSGDWKFKYYGKVSEMPDTLDVGEVLFDDIKVPSCWQRTGYEPPVYLNVRYPFDTNPPYFPEDISAGVYYKKFSIDKTCKKHYILTFLGVCSCAELYVNGKFVGYSEGSHNSAEFDIDGYINAGENELLVVVYKWCNGTYLEDQDMFRENGIFRDVYITEYEDVYIWDYYVDTEKKDGGLYDLKLIVDIKRAMHANIDNIAETKAANKEAPKEADIETIEEGAATSAGAADIVESEADSVDTESVVKNESGEIKNGVLRLRAELRHGDTVIASEIAEVSGEKNTIVLKDLNVKEWSAEIPEIYELFVILENENTQIDCVRNYTGFKNITIEGNVFKFNGAKIKIKGVNHHDSTPHGGYVMTAEEMKKDILIMKEYNVNAVRTSHYPKDPLFLTLCDIYGLYVIDEADIETHGCFEPKKVNIFNKQAGMNRISDDPKWEKHYLDRVKRMYRKDRNHPCVTMWSLGNEAGGIRNQDACYAMLKKEGAKIPVHYEGARHVFKRMHYDVISTMYPFMRHVNGVVNKTGLPVFRKVPYFFCEYAHAMGFGPGNLKEYVEAFYACDSLMGGCIWEFVDHAVIHKEGEGKYKYTYGGDHGEEKHDGNFCVDGLFYPDRTPHTGALNMKAVYRPVIVSKGEGDGEYIVTNRNRFLSLSYVDIRWIFMKNGAETASGNLFLDVAPEKSQKIVIPHRKPDKNGDFHINFVCVDKRDGYIISEEQIELNASAAFVKSDDTVYDAEFIDDGTVLTVKFKGGRLTFDKKNGRMTSLKYKEREYLNTNPESGITGFYPSVYRAPLDNDNIIRVFYKFFGTENLTLVFKGMTVKSVGGKNKKEKNKVEICVKYGLHSKYKLYGVKVTYLIDGKGRITVTAKLRVTALICRVWKKMAPIPRFGMEVELDSRFNNIEYFGRGEGETLPDIAEHAVVGVYRKKVGELREKYIKPQDSGNRSGVRYMKISDDKDNGLMFKKKGENFNFNASNFTIKELLKAAHQEDLEIKSTVDLRIDGFVRGAGSNSCGPWPLKKYTINTNKPLAFSFVIEPLKY
ncbi:MAG: DUF4981 domain-containing protein [Clostridiales bacterium]|jgi:beta-galactosidase/beta-glucuronidase|nr:DUF4981 domain-containing protein [Clostridiales bacterium]